MSTDKQFKNGFEAWKETYFEVVAALTATLDVEGSMAEKTYTDGGRCAMYSLAEELTDRFEDLYEKDYIEGWIERDYFDTIDEFFVSQEKEYKEIHSLLTDQ